MRGFGSGLIWGGVIGALGLVIVSENSPLPGEIASPKPEAAAPAAPAAEGSAATADPAAPKPVESVVVAPHIAVPETPKADKQAALPATPEAGSATLPTGDAVTSQEPVLSANVGDASADPSHTNDAPEAVIADVVPLPTGLQPEQSPPEPDLTVPDVSVGPAASDFPEVVSPDAAGDPPNADSTSAAVPDSDPTVTAPPQPSADDTSLPDIAATTAGPDIVEPSAGPSAPQPETPPAMADLPPPPPLTPDEQALADAAPEAEPGAETLPDAAVLPSDAPLAPVAPLPGAEEEAAATATASLPPATGFSGDVDGVVTGRLPRIGDAPAVSDEAALVADTSDLPPVDRFAREFKNPEGKPVFSIILLDNGDPGLDRDKLAALPFPVTFALDPTLPNVGRLASIYRNAGQEVAMLATGLPEGATAADVEVTFAAHDAAMPEAVAVIDLGKGGFQTNRPLATLVVPVIKGQGRGLLTYDAGLNAADQVASRDGVRSATIFRQIDAPGEPVSAIRRVLDRAAFKAAQVGRVAVVGEARPETVAALLEWTVEGRAASVILAPATAVMVTR